MDHGEIPQNVDSALPDDRCFACRPLHRESTHRRANPAREGPATSRCTREITSSVEAQPYVPGATFVAHLFDTESYDGGLSEHLKAIHHQCRKLKRLQPPRQVFLELLRRLAHEVTAGGTSCSCHDTSTWPRVCPDSIRNFPIPPQDLIPHSLLVFFAEGAKCWKRRTPYARCFVRTLGRARVASIPRPPRVIS